MKLIKYTPYDGYRCGDEAHVDAADISSITPSDRAGCWITLKNGRVFQAANEATELVRRVAETMEEAMQITDQALKLSLEVIVAAKALVAIPVPVNDFGRCAYCFCGGGEPHTLHCAWNNLRKLVNQ